MRPGWLRPVGATGLQVSAIGAGGGPLGSMPATFGRDVPAADGIATVGAVLASDITLLDTSNGYGGGESERRIGAALAAAGGVPDGFVLATKVDPDDNGRFDAARVRRSVEESLGRLGVDRVDLLHLHDPEFSLTFEEAMAAGGPVAELERIRDEGIAGHLGVAGGDIALMRRFVETGRFEVLLTHNRYTLVDRSAEETIDVAHRRGVAVINAAVLGGGILAVGATRSDHYAYRPASAATLAAIAAIEELCADYGVPLAAAALQFSLRDQRISSTLVGFSRPDRVAETLHLAAADIPADLWDRVERHVPPPENWMW